MELNSDVRDILKEFKIDINKGTLCLLAIYYRLDATSIIDEETIKAINLTKIVERNYGNGTVTWNIPLFQGQNTDWDWVKTEFNALWNRNMGRKASNPDVIKRMQEFFKKYPVYRKDDVIRAVQSYHASQRDPQYLKNSAGFIFDGQGAQKKSILLGWCERTKDGSSGNNMKGSIIT